MISDADIARLLPEDVGGGDLTTEALGLGTAPGRMVFRARGRMVLAGVGAAERMMASPSVEIRARDVVVDQGHVMPFVDAASRSHASGVTVDFVIGLESNGSVFDNPNAASKCWCGKSFS